MNRKAIVVKSDKKSTQRMKPKCTTCLWTRVEEVLLFWLFSFMNNINVGTKRQMEFTLMRVAFI